MPMRLHFSSSRRWTLRLLLASALPLSPLAAADAVIPFDAQAVRWIWSSVDSDHPAGAQNFFRRSLELGEVKAAQLAITCDNGYELYVNDRFIASDSAWETVEVFDVQKFLKTGSNTIAVRGVNDGGPAALAIQLHATLADDNTVAIRSDKSWKVSPVAPPKWTTTEFDDTSWNAASELATLGSGPWGNTAAMATSFTPVRPADARPREVPGGDRVILLGSAFIERAARYGYLETALTSAWPRRAVFRNLGWSGDTVFGHARSYFGPPKEGFERLRRLVYELHPTTIVVAYGAVESFKGEAGLAEFLLGLERMLEMLARTGAKIVIATPPPLESLGPPLPDPRLQNKNIALYASELRKVAEKRGDAVLDIHQIVSSVREETGDTLTSDGLHLTAYGYWRVASAVADALGAERAPWSIAIDGTAGSAEGNGTSVADVQKQSSGITFKTVDAALPVPTPPVTSHAGKESNNARVVTARNLSPGRYALHIDGAAVAVANAKEWSKGIAVSRGPSFDQVEQLRQLVLEKNNAFFHRWRPQNETYLFGFRKHEQGEHAAEIPQFDPIVQRLEDGIERTRQPKSQTYEFVRVGN